MAHRSATGMTRIFVSREAYLAIARTLPDDDGAQAPQANRHGRLPLWVEAKALDQLAAARGPSEGYSEAILRLAAMEGR